MGLIYTMGLLPWLALGVAFFGFIIFTTENDSPFVATVTTITLLIVLQLFSGFQPLSYVVDHPIATTIGVLAYVAVGPFIGMLKWLSFAHDVADRWAAARAKAVSYYLSSYKKASEKDFTEAEMRQVLGDARQYFGSPRWDINLKVSQHKSRITTWMLFWPATLFWLLLNDPIRRLYNYIYTRMAGTLTKISDRAMAPFKADFIK